MIIRKLHIEFKKNGDVYYSFFKQNSKYKLYKYLIEYPFEFVEIIGGQDYNKDNYSIKKTIKGFALLTWDKVLEDEEGSRGIKYIKKKYLKPSKTKYSDNTLKYQEKLKIKCKKNDRFGLWLHSPNSEISAIKNNSSAIFLDKNYEPKELSEIVFKAAGVVDVNWELEIIKE